MDNTHGQCHLCKHPINTSKPAPAFTVIQVSRCDNYTLDKCLQVFRDVESKNNKNVFRDLMSLNPLHVETVDWMRLEKNLFYWWHKSRTTEFFLESFDKVYKQGQTDQHIKTKLILRNYLHKNLETLSSQQITMKIFVPLLRELLSTAWLIRTTYWVGYLLFCLKTKVSIFFTPCCQPDPWVWMGYRWGEQLLPMFKILYAFTYKWW